MFEKWKEKMIAKKINKLNQLPVFCYRLDSVNYQIGTYGTGSRRAFDILFDTNTKEELQLVDVSITLNENKALIIRGTRKLSQTPFHRVFQKEEINWRLFHHMYNIGLDEKLDLCYNPNGGILDIGLRNKDSIIIGYTIDQKKEYQLIVS